MSQQMTTVSARLPMPLDAPVKPQQWRVLTDAIWPNAKTAEAVLMALEYCRVRNLDPFKRPVHIVPMYSTASKRTIETCWPGINELQVTAARSGAWAGMDEPVWGSEREYTFTGKSGEDDEGRPVQAKDVTVRVPESCTVTVYRNVDGRRESFAEPVYWIEAYARVSRWSEAPNAMWLKRPRGQLHKCAKAASLRAAFPEDLGGTYAAEEMEDKETEVRGPVIEMKIEEARVAAPSEEETEFLVRAESSLMEGVSNGGSAWLKAFLFVVNECPSLPELSILLGWDGVRNSRQAAPKLIQAQIADAIKAAESRLTAPKIEVALADIPPTEDPAATTLIDALNACDTDAEVLALTKEHKAQIADYAKNAPATHTRITTAIDAKRAALNDPGAA